MKRPKTLLKYLRKAYLKINCNVGLCSVTAWMYTGANNTKPKITKEEMNRLMDIIHANKPMTAEPGAWWFKDIPTRINFLDKLIKEN